MCGPCASGHKPLFCTPRLWSRRSTIDGRLAPVAQLDRALPSGGRGRAFESRRAYSQEWRQNEISPHPSVIAESATLAGSASGTPLLPKNRSRCRFE
jgi:hypothetical protein